MESRRNFLKGALATAVLGGLESSLSGCTVHIQSGSLLQWLFPHAYSQEEIQRFHETEAKVNSLRLDLLQLHQTNYRAMMREHYAFAGLEHLQSDEYIVSAEIMEVFTEAAGTKKKGMNTWGMYFDYSPSPAQQHECKRLLGHLQISFHDRIALQTLFSLPQKIVYKEQIFFDGNYGIIMPHERAHRYMDQSLTETEHRRLEEGYERMRRLTFETSDPLTLDRLNYAFTNYTEFFPTLVEGLLPEVENALQEHIPKANIVYQSIKEASQL